MNKLFVGVAVIVVALIVLAFAFTQQPVLVGGDKDAYGCIPSAGYSWCEVKQKCIRAWEENCTKAVANLSDQGNCSAACHSCHFELEGPVACTMEWRPEYVCDRYIDCGKVFGKCVMLENKFYKACISCVGKCGIDQECLSHC